MTETRNLADTAPAVIDADIAALENELDGYHDAIAQAARRLNRIHEAVANNKYYPGDPEIEIPRNEETIIRCRRHIAEAREVLAPLTAEYDRRRWTRYYLVDNTGGHVHSSTHCGSCYPRTRYFWLTSESGKTAREVVAIAKTDACTVCFPWAPVVTERGAYRTPSQAEAEARAAEKAAKAAAKKAKEITTPEGGPLREISENRGGLYYHGQVKTAISARRAVSDALWNLDFYREDHPEAIAWRAIVEQYCAALGAHEGRPAQEIKVEIAARVEKKRAAERRKYGH